MAGYVLQSQLNSFFHDDLFNFLHSTSICHVAPNWENPRIQAYPEDRGKEKHGLMRDIQHFLLFLAEERIYMRKCVSRSVAFSTGQRTDIEQEIKPTELKWTL